jgi:PilZ domain
MEQRKTVRYQVRAPVLFKWTDADAMGVQGGGFTRDISTGGLFVCCDRLPPLKTVLSMEVLLSLVESPSPGLRLMGQGVVVRLEKRENQTGFAAKTKLDLNRGEMDPN